MFYTCINSGGLVGGTWKMSFLRSFKRSPRKEVRMALQENRPWVAERSHKQGHSFETCDGGQFFMTKDDLDLTLFTEIKTREKEDFLLHSIDDLDDSISKLRSVSKDKAGFDTLNHGETSNLLNADGGKNDYDWLLTPPDTPLFNSLDDDVPPPKNYDTKARDEKNRRPSISSASSHHRSPGNNSSNFQSRGRTSSVPRSSSTSVLRSSPSTPPSRKSSTPPSKLSTPSSMTATPKLRGNSPIKGSRGSSSSPKLQRPQPNTTDFALDAPPNLRTSLLDSPSSYSRGSSPASRNGKQPYSKHGRQSISPTISRSVSSSRSHDHKRNSTHNKVSAVSYGVGGESLQSAPVRISKKASRTQSPSSAPKRSFDLALRQMDHRKTPQNMFRPLISSVPSSSFFTTKENTLHHPFLSRNSSVTTSCDVGAGVALDTEDYSYQANHSGLHEEMFDKVGKIEEDAKYEIFLERTLNDDDGLDESMGCMAKEIKLGYENGPFDAEEIDPATSETLCVRDQFVMDSVGRMLTCSICGESFQNANVDNMNNICRDCALNNVLSGQMGTKATQHSIQMEENHHKIEHAANVVCDQPYSKEDMLELFDQMDSDAVLDIQPAKGVEVPDHVIVSQLRMADQVHQNLETLRSVSTYKFKNSTPFSPSPSSNLRSNGSEGAAISLASKRSNGNKGIVVQGQGMAFSASNTTYFEISCTGENQNATTSNYSQRSSTTSSPLDLASLKQMEEHIQRQRISMKDSTDSLKHDSSSKSHSSLSPSPKCLIQTSKTQIEGDRDQLISMKDSTDSLKHDSSSKSHSSLSLSPKNLIQASNTKIEGNQNQLDADFGGDSSTVNDECFRKTVEDIDGSASSIGLHDQEYTECTNNCSVLIDNVLSDSLSCSKNSHTSAPTIDPQTYQASILQQFSEINQIDKKNITEICVSSDDISSNSCIENEREKIFDTNVMCKSSVSSLEMGNNDSFKSLDLDDDCFSISCNDILSEKGDCIDHHVLNHDNHAKSIHEEESAVGVHSSHGQQKRNLEDAAYTLHFCNSIIEDLVYKAATIAIEKKQAYTTGAKVSHPTATILEKPNSNLKTAIKTPLPKSPNAESKASGVPLLPTNALNNAKDKTKVEEESDDTNFNHQIAHSGTGKTAKIVSKCMCTVM